MQMRTRDITNEKNSEEFSDKEGDDSKRYRRPRRSTGERNYICGCTKVGVSEDRRTSVIPLSIRM